MTLTVKDAGARSDFANLKVELLDINDNAPEFTRDVYDVYLDEGDEVFVSSPFITIKVCSVYRTHHN